MERKESGNQPKRTCTARREVAFPTKVVSGVSVLSRSVAAGVGPGYLLAGILFLCTISGCAWLQQFHNGPNQRSRTLLQRAQEAEERENWQQAESLLVEASRAAPDNPEIGCQLAEVLRQQGETEAALEHLRRVAEQTPDDPRVHEKLAQLLIEQERRRAAERHLSRALELNPQDLDTLFLRAKLARLRGETESALATYHRILRLAPHNNKARVQIAQLQLEQEKAEQAAPLLRYVCNCTHSSREEQSEARWLLGIAYGQDERWSNAAEVLARAIENRSEPSPDDWYRLAYAQYQAENRSAALQSLEKALELDPEHENALAMASVIGTDHDSFGHSSEKIVPVGHTVEGIRAPEGW